jgi:hypothetical protein
MVSPKAIAMGPDDDRKKYLKTLEYACNRRRTRGENAGG